MCLVEKVMRKRQKEDKMKITALQRELHQLWGKNLDQAVGGGGGEADIITLMLGNSWHRDRKRGGQNPQRTPPYRGKDPACCNQSWPTRAAGSQPISSSLANRHHSAALQDFCHRGEAGAATLPYHMTVSLQWKWTCSSWHRC